MARVLLVFTMFSFVLSFGGTSLTHSVCPNITQDARAIISKIQTLSSQIEQAPECQAISEKLAIVTKVVSSDKWKVLRNTLKSGQTTSIEGAEVEEVSQLVQDASSTLTEVVSSIVGNKQCVSHKQRSSFLTNISGVVREVSNIVGNVTGPYGLAINLGGNLLSGAISGIDKILSRNRINFSDPELELLFMNQYCSFAEVQKDINDYLTLDSRADELKILDSYLDLKIKDLNDNCPECHGYSLAWHAREKARLIMSDIETNANIIPLGDDLNSQYFNRCKEINRSFHTQNSSFRQLFNLLSSYENPMLSISDTENINDLVEMSIELEEHYPSAKDCSFLSFEDKNKIAKDFNSLIRDEVLPLNREVFTNHMSKLQYIANNIKYKKPLGDYIQTSLDRKKWINHESQRSASEVHDPNYQISIGRLIEQSDELSYRITERMFLQYLKFQFKKTKTILKSFVGTLNKGQKSNQLHLDPRVRLSLEKKSLSILKKALSRASSIQRYCDFDKYMLASTVEKDKQCRDVINDLQEKLNEVSKLDSKALKLIEKAELFKSNDFYQYQSNRTVEFSNKVNTWNKLGSARWCLKDQQYLKQGQSIPVECQ